MSALRVAGAAILAALAVLVALLAADVRAWHGALAQGDATYGLSASRARWTPATRLGGLAESLLGTQADVAERQALVLYDSVAGVQQRLDNGLAVQTQRSRAIGALGAPAASPDAARASRARTLLGILEFANVSHGGGTSQTDAAIADFTDAIRVDPGNVAAKFDLELLLRLTAAHGTRTGAGQSNGFGRTGRRGAAGGVPGSGY